MKDKPLRFKPSVDKQSQCEGKRSFETYKAAKTHYNFLHRKFPMCIYKCHFCGQFHAGQNTRKKKLKVRGVDADC